MTEPTSDSESPGRLPEGAKGSGAYGWRRRERPLRLERRLEFANYDGLREFLDRTADLSEQIGIYPNLSFGRTYVNLTLFADEGEQEMSAEAQAFADGVDELAGAGAG